METKAASRQIILGKMLKSLQQLIIDTSQETKAKAEDIHAATWQHFHISRH